MSVAGKTGTAEQAAAERKLLLVWLLRARGRPPSTSSSPNVDGGDWGSSTAMLVARDTLGAIYGEPDTASTVYAVGD